MVGDQAETPLTTRLVPLSALRPNPWNPNKMDAATFEREKASIATFGFIDPVTARQVDVGEYEIIDGEHRWVAADQLGLKEIPVIILDVSVDEAKELTIILNEVRGTADEERLSALVKDLGERRDRVRMESLLYDRARLDQLLERQRIDWDELERQQARPVERKREEPWVERVYRLPRSSASVIDDAIERVKTEEAIEQDWRALEMIAADYLGS